MKKGIFVIGGYGIVGGKVVEILSQRNSDCPIVCAGRSREKAERFSSYFPQNVKSAQFNIYKFEESTSLFVDIAIVICCVEHTNIKFVEFLIWKKIHYMDISASKEVLNEFEKLYTKAKQNKVSIIISVGLAPGLSNLLAKHTVEQLNCKCETEIFIMLGLGEKFGEASMDWVINNLCHGYTIKVGDKEHQLNNFHERKDVAFFNDPVNRPAYNFNFSDQHTIVRTLNISTAKTYLCFDSIMVTKLLAFICRTGLIGYIFKLMGKKKVVHFIRKISFGKDDFAIKVITRGKDENNDVFLATAGIRGKTESKATAEIVAFVSDQISQLNIPKGVYHMEEIFNIRQTLPYLSEMEFNESNNVSDVSHA